ncbi:MAG: PAS domain S-box protein [Promethearchaeota archaeon]
MGENQSDNTVNLFKTIYNDSPIGIEIYDLNGKLIDVNQSCLELFGVYSKDDIKGFNLLDDPNVPKKYLTKLKQGESVRYESIFDFDLVKSYNLYKTAKSGKIYLDVLITPLFLTEDKSISNYLVQVRDISAQKIAEQKLILFNEELEKKIQDKIKELKKLEANWRVLVEEAPDIILTVDRSGYILYINRDFLVKTREDVIGTNVLDYINTKHHEIVKKSIEKVFQTGEPGYYEICSIEPNNDKVWYSTRLGAIKEGEEVKSVMVLAREITEKKKVEQKLRESEEKFKILTEQSLMGIGILQDGLVKYASKKLADIYGFSIEEILNFEPNRFLSLIDPEFLELVRAQSRKKQLGDEDVITNYEHKIIKKTGEKRWVENYSKSINYKGKPADLVINLDITERKKAENKLRESKQLLQTTLYNLQDAIFILDDKIPPKVIDCNPASKKIFGYLQSELIGSTTALLHVDDNSLKTFQTLVLPKLQEHGNIQNFEYKMKRKDGTIFPTEHAISEFRNEKGEKFGLVSLVRDITTRKKFEEKIHYQAKLVDEVSDAIISTDLNFNIITWNKAAESIYGWSEKEAIRKNISAIIPATYPYNKEKDVIKKLLEEGFWKGEVVQYNRECLPLIILSSVSMIKDIKGDPTGIVVINHDITEYKIAEEKIRESEKKILDLIESVPVGISITTPEGNIIECNSNAVRLFGYNSKEEFMDTLVIELYHSPNDRDNFLELHKNGMVNNLEIQFRRKNGSSFWGSLNSIAHNIGNQTYFINSFQDITERKEAELRIQQSEEKYRSLFNNAPFAIVLFNIEGYILDCNDATFKITGYQKDELIGKNFKEFDFYIDIRNADIEKRKEEIKQGKVPKPREILLKNKDRVEFWARTYLEFIYLGTETYIQAIIQDISDQKRAEQKLKDSEEKYRNISNQYKMLLESITDGVYALNRDWEYILVNKNAESLINIPINKLLGNKIFDVFPGIEKTTFFKVYDNVMKTRNSERVIDSFILPDGKQGYFEVNVYPIKEGILCIGRNVTEEKQIEKKLKQSEERLKYLVSSSPSVIYSSKTSGNYGTTFMSDNVEKMWGYSSDLFLNDSDFWIEHVHPEDKENVFDILSKLFEKEHIVFQYRFKLNDGTYHWMRDEIMLIRDDSGNPVETIGSVIDIDDRVKAEQKLIKSEEKYRTLINNIPGMIYRGNPDWTVQFISNSEIISGYREEDFNSQEINWIHIIHPKDRDAIIKEGNLMNENPISLSQVYRIITKNGVIKWVNDYKSSYFDEKGSFCGVDGVVYDITARKKVEQELKESEEKFRTIAEQSTLGIFIQQDDEIKFVNKAFSEIIEYPMEEINRWKARDILKVVYQEDLQRVKEKGRLREENDYDEIINYECRILTKSEKVKWVEIMSKAIRYLGKYALLISVIDITARKKVEEQLLEIGNLKSELLSRTSHELKTPLVSIKGYTDLLLTQHYRMLDIYTISVLNEIKQGCHRLESLIQDLLETSKLESEEIKLNKEEEDLAFLIRFCIRDLRGLLEARNHELVLDIQNNMYTLMEKERIYEVIMNLLSNSIKYTPPNGQILIKSEIKEDKYLISIKDNGIGLTENEKIKVFKKFGKIERYGKGMDVVSEGSGLGLYISKRIIDLHGGEIWVDSEGRNKGSTFFFSLPIIKK